MKKYSLSMSFTTRMTGHFLRLLGAAVCIVIASLSYTDGDNLTGIIVFCGFIAFGIFFVIAFTAGLFTDIRNKGVDMVIDGENIIFLDGNKRTAHTFAEITQVCSDYSVHPDRKRMWICFGKYEQHPFYTDMKNADRLIESLKEYGIKEI